MTRSGAAAARHPAVGVALAAALAAPAGAPAADLAPHEALYSMSRESSNYESGVAGVRGRLQLEIEAACDGWRFDQLLGFRVLGTDDSVLEHLAQLSGFESADGREFWFNTRTYENRELVETLAGVARLDANGAGELRLAEPAEERRALPPGTLFPTGHIEALVDAARAGERQLTRTVYDGSTLESPYEIAAAIGARRRGAAPGFPALDDAWAWPVQLAYYPVPAVEPTPEFQMRVLLFENGVAGDMVYDYGSFTVAVELEALDMLARPSCP